jgi:hypothetical protein
LAIVRAVSIAVQVVRTIAVSAALTVWAAVVVPRFVPQLTAEEFLGICLAPTEAAIKSLGILAGGGTPHLGELLEIETLLRVADVLDAT